MVINIYIYITQNVYNLPKQQYIQNTFDKNSHIQILTPYGSGYITSHANNQNNPINQQYTQGNT